MAVEDGDLYPAVSMVYGLTEVTVKLKSSTFSESENQEAAAEDRGVTNLEDTEDEKCLTTTPLRDTDVEEKQTQFDSHQQNTTPAKKEINKDEAKKEITKEQEDEVKDDKDELDEEIALASLPETERHLLKIGHAWDDVARAGRIHLHPNAPDICIPARNFGDKVQGVRSKRQLRKGRHCWLLQEVRVYEPGSEEEDGKPNNLIMGIG